MTTKAHSRKMTITERLTLLGTIPQEGNYLDMKILRKFRESLSFTEEEQKTLEMKPLEDGRVFWKQEKDPNKAIYFGRRMEAIIVDALTKLNQENKLTEAHMSLYEMFVGGDNEDDE